MEGEARKTAVDATGERHPNPGPNVPRSAPADL
jgi:hypothetical protein